MAREVERDFTGQLACLVDRQALVAGASKFTGTGTIFDEIAELFVLVPCIADELADLLHDNRVRVVLMAQ